MKNFLIYPCKIMRITQNYNGSVSHRPHTTGKPKDYPIDESGIDSGKQALYCPCDEMKLIIKYGQGNGGTNTLFLQSTAKVDFADGTSDFFSMQITHPNDSDLKKLTKGQIFKRGEIICHEGSDGGVGNHLHISGGKGKIQGNGWVKNTKGKWVLNPTKGGFKPEKLFYIDKSFTTVISSRALTFKELPQETAKSYTKGDYEVTADVLNVRTGPGTNYDKKTYEQFTKDAQNKILMLVGYKANGYVKLLQFTALEVKGNWGRTPSGWVCLDYCKRI